ncbi:uncharacterized protein [Oscarella lobularis]|uniref:uncharacterized protein n=1 Tax=Oscarella lobularis TaxID=121494 RepID=UPI00331414B2
MACSQGSATRGASARRKATALPPSSKPRKAGSSSERRNETRTAVRQAWASRHAHLTKSPHPSSGLIILIRANGNAHLTQVAPPTLLGHVSVIEKKPSCLRRRRARMEDGKWMKGGSAIANMAWHYRRGRRLRFVP